VRALRDCLKFVLNRRLGEGLSTSEPGRRFPERSEEASVVQSKPTPFISPTTAPEPARHTRRRPPHSSHQDVGVSSDLCCCALGSQGRPQPACERGGDGQHPTAKVNQASRAGAANQGGAGGAATAAAAAVEVAAAIPAPSSACLRGPVKCAAACHQLWCGAALAVVSTRLGVRERHSQQSASSTRSTLTPPPLLLLTLSAACAAMPCGCGCHHHSTHRQTRTGHRTSMRRCRLPHQSLWWSPRARAKQQQQQQQQLARAAREGQQQLDVGAAHNASWESSSVTRRATPAAAAAGSCRRAHLHRARAHMRNDCRVSAFEGACSCVCAATQCWVWGGFVGVRSRAPRLFVCD
jgi:hypothetical protein